ncbi:MAG TPA: TetR/AcrR family transcriptional regulator [Candidatus Binatia bacterium]|jgi:AcrR family transcriptional regulator
MSTAKPGAAAGDDVTDGRHLRSRSSRARIVEALSRLVREGDVLPGAARVAEVAGVGLRTVFRHFEDMDSLYREIAALIAAQVLPALFAPYRGTTWQARLGELVARRCELYEAILPYKVAGDLRRFQSPFLRHDYEQQLELEKHSLASVLPAELAADETLQEALRAATSFQAWRILRHDQALSPAQARAVVERSVAGLSRGVAGTAIESKTIPGGAS